MKAASNELLALFSTDLPFEQFDLYTFTLQTGLVLRYTNCPFDVTFDATTWYCSTSSNGVVIDERGDSGPRGRWNADMASGSWEITVMPRSTDLLGSRPWLPAVRAGLLDEAVVQVDRGYVQAWPSVPTLAITPLGVVSKIFYGRVAELDLGRSSVSINMEDMRALLDIQMPRNLFSAQCRYALFDSGCTLNKATFAVNAIVNGVTDDQTLNTTAGQATGYFSLGEVLFTSGENAGLRQLIRSYTQTGGVIELLTPMPFQVMNGDAVTLYPGCDKTSATCNDKFANRVNFGGEPFIPAPESAQ